MLHLEYLKMTRDASKSIRFNLVVIDQTTKQTKFPDFLL
jgi:hypothetical protein